MGITENVDKGRHPYAETLEREVEWMAQRLEQARAVIADSSILIAYDNGGGQKGVRKNPGYEAYAQLFNAFVRGMQALDQVLEGAAPTSEGARMTLDNLRVMVSDRLKVAK